MQEKPTLLIVDDERSDILLMEDIVKELGVHCVMARSGHEALELVKDGEAISLILLDINMPKMNGFELALKLRELPQCRETPIIFVSASTDDQSEIAAYEYGAIDFICKPISPYVFRCKVALHVKLFHSYLGLLKAMKELHDFKGMLDQSNQLVDTHSTSNATQYKEALQAIRRRNKIMLAGVERMRHHNQEVLETISFYNPAIEQLKEA